MLILDRRAVTDLPTLPDCLTAVEDVFRRHALGQLVTGQRPGRTKPEAPFVFDSTGTALQDVAAAALGYARACAEGRGVKLAL